MTSEPCQFLEWDSNFFGRRIARVNGPAFDPGAVMGWCAAHSIDCLYYLANADDIDSIRQAEDYAFRLVEIRLNYECSLKSWDPQKRPRTAEGITIRPGGPADVPAIQAIARTSYVDSRFYFDKNFSEADWQRYYATWVKKSFEGGAPLALVAEKDDEIVGYITGLVMEGGLEGQYELTGVLESVRRLGVGNELFRSGLDWYVRNGVQQVWLATQGRNIATQRMIQRNGFITRSCQLYYHKWFSPQTSG